MILSPTPLPGVLPITPAKEAAQRAAVIREALSWVGTPYRQLGGRKGAGVDCAMLLVRSWIEAGIYEEFDPRPYPPEWHLHQNEERYMEWMRTVTREVSHPKPGDIVLYKFGRCMSHSGIVVADGLLVHAHLGDGFCLTVEMNAPWLCYMRDGKTPRPQRFFDPWAYLKTLEG